MSMTSFFYVYLSYDSCLSYLLCFSDTSYDWEIGVYLDLTTALETLYTREPCRPLHTQGPDPSSPSPQPEESLLRTPR